MNGNALHGANRLAAQLAQKGAAAGRRAARHLAAEIAEGARARAPGRLGEALQAVETADGAEVTAPGFARFVEFGTRRQAAHPFLRPALEEARARWQAGRG